MEIDSGPLVLALEDATHEEFDEAARRWFSASQEHLEEAMTQRGGGGDDRADDSEGRVGRQQHGLHSIHQSGQYLGFQESRGGFVFRYTHFATEFHEFGTQPHEIVAAENSFLAFKWPDAPDDVVAMFSPGGEDDVNRGGWDGWVYFKSVDHPGNPAIGFIRHGKAVAEQFLKHGPAGSGSQ